MLSVLKLDTLTEKAIEGLGDTLDGYEALFDIEIKNNVSELWEINGGESYCITRLEYDRFKHYHVLVICTYRGKNIEQFCDHVLPLVEKNNWKIRFHTFKPAFAKWMGKKYGFTQTEYVLLRE